MKRWKTLSLIVLVVLVVVLILALIISIFKIPAKSNSFNKEYIESGTTEEMGDKFSLVGGMVSDSDEEIPSEIMKILNVKWPQVSVLSNSILQKHSLDKFYYSEKTDGEHMNILIYNGTIFNVTRFDNIQAIDTLKNKGLTLILDTELYNDKFYIFDVYYVQDKLVKDEKFIERMSYCGKFIDELENKFVVKEFKPIPSLKFLLEFINNPNSPVTGNEIDGVILQRIDKPYFPSRFEANIYKLKPRCLMTVDFLLKYNTSTSSYDLYTIGSFMDMLNQLTLKPKQTKFVYDSDGKVYERKDLRRLPINLFILFDSPFIPNLSSYKVEETWNSLGYFPRIVHSVNYLIGETIKTPNYFDGKIVEMSLTNDNKWVPIRIREDKLRPNGNNVAQSNISLIFDPIKPTEEIYFQRDISSSSKIQTFVHKINQIYRKFIIESHINPIGGNATILDLCGGRGADQYNLYANGITNFFVIDADTTALKQYVDRSYSLRGNFIAYQKKPETSYKPLVPGWRKNITNKGNNFTVNVLHHQLGGSYVKIMKDLKSRYEYRGNVKIVLMNFAIHYLCDKASNISKLTNFINEILDTRGIFIFTYFDGDYILDNAKVVGRKKVSKIGPFDIEITHETANYTKAKMPLVTIQGGEDFYKEEPLVHRDVFENIDKKMKFITDYPIYDETSRFIDLISDEDEFKNLLEYYKLIRVRVYGKII